MLLHRGMWSKPVPRKTHCPNGHELTPKNTRIVTTKGRNYPSCKECNRIACRAAYRRKHPKKEAPLLRPRNEKGWIIPAEGTKGRALYDKLMAGYAPHYTDKDYHACWSIMHPNRLINYKRKMRGSAPRPE